MGASAQPTPQLAETTVPSRRGRRRSKKQFDSRRNEIVDLAAKLFAANGYNETGIREIGEAANLARGALYHYIDSKESLLNEIHDRALDPLIESITVIAAMDVTVTERLRMASESLIRQIAERHDHMWVFLHEHRSLTGERRDAFQAKRARFEKQLNMLLYEGVVDGEFEITNVRATMLAFLGMHEYTYQWIRPSMHIDPKDLSKIYCDIFVSGISRQS